MPAPLEDGPAERPAEPVDASRTPPLSRTEQRKAQTRQALVAAVRVMLQNGTAMTAGIRDITDAADVGLGSFYNYFRDKEDLLMTVAVDVLTPMATEIRKQLEDVEDIAIVIATAVRTVCESTLSNPELGTIFMTVGFKLFGHSDGMGSLPERNIRIGVERGRFRVSDVALAKNLALGLCVGWLHSLDTAPNLNVSTSIDELLEKILCVYGMPMDEARELAQSTSALRLEGLNENAPDHRG